MSSSSTSCTRSLRVDTYDVFATGRQFTGNQLAVFSEGCEDLSTEQMQQLAAEMNYAESTFLLLNNKPSNDGDEENEDNGNQFGYRIFTPAFELPFAGHPTLGTAHHAMKHCLGTSSASSSSSSSSSSVLLQCTGGIIPVTRDDDGLLWMQQQPPQCENDNVAASEVAQALGCNVEILDHQDFPCQVYSTGGTSFLVAAVKDLDSLKRIVHPGSSMFPFCQRVGAVGLYLVTREGRDDSHSISARSMIAETAVPEDPATGSACGCFAGWAVDNGFAPVDDTGKASFSVGQGHEMGRPSLLHVRVERAAATTNLKVQVGGRVIPVVRQGHVTLE